jgi:hypothetical protein
LEITVGVVISFIRAVGSKPFSNFIKYISAETTLAIRTFDCEFMGYDGSSQTSIFTLPFFDCP